MSEVDLLFAKAAFASEFDCVIPKFTDRVHLRDARHPLLQDVLRKQKKRVVPVSLTLDGRTRTLLISGPNTGGKTVSMKTVGLLVLMAQSALPVPATEAAIRFRRSCRSPPRRGSRRSRARSRGGAGEALPPLCPHSAQARSVSRASVAREPGGGRVHLGEGHAVRDRLVG